MKEPTRITRRFEQTTTPSEKNTTQTKNKPNSQITSFITSGRNNQNINSQNNAISNNSKTEIKRSHVQRLTAEERKKFSRGLRVSAAERERAKIENMDPKERENMIEIIDNTNNSDINKREIKLKSNIKKSLINKKRIITSTNENQELKKNEPISNLRNTREKPNLLDSNQSKITPILNNKRSNQDAKLLENKNVINKNQKYIPYSITKKVDPIKPTYNKSDLRNNIVSNSINESHKKEIKPYVLNERATDTIKYRPTTISKQKDTKVDDKVQLYQNKENRKITVTQNIRKEQTTVANLPNDKKLQNRYNNTANQNLKNSGYLSINETKKETKKEVTVQPRKNTIISSRTNHLTDKNKDNFSKTYDKQNLYDKNKNKDDKNRNIADSKNNRQNAVYQPGVRNENIIQNKNKDENKYQKYQRNNNNINNDKNVSDIKYINRRGNNQIQNRSTGVSQKINKEEYKRPEPNLAHNNLYRNNLDKEKSPLYKQGGYTYESKYTKTTTTTKEQPKPKQLIINTSQYTRKREDKLK